MNSRDAAFDESLKEVLEATAAEAAAVESASTVVEPAVLPAEPEVTDSKKKRKRADDDS